MRQKIKQVIPFDIFKENIFERNQIEPKSFDCVMSNLCLDSACATDADYKSAVLKMSRFLKPGGYFLMAGGLYATYMYYKVGDHVFKNIYIRPELIQDALEGAGFSNVNEVP